MDAERYFLEPRDGFYRNQVVHGAAATFFTDNAVFYDAVLADLRRAGGPQHFVYFAGWWSDLRLPLGDPRRNPPPPTLGAVLRQLAQGRKPAANQQSMAPSTRLDGPQICAMVWNQAAQTPATTSIFGKVLRAVPRSLFGSATMAEINGATVTAIRNLGSGGNFAVLDGRHASIGSHHQKFIVMDTDRGPVAYIGSSDFNADRLYAERDGAAPSPPAKGSPLNDVNVRLSGPIVQQISQTFVDRWKAHPDARRYPLTGDRELFTTSSVGASALVAQVSHTYAPGWPFKEAVRSAADAQLQIIRAATKYVYFEDQYLIGTNELCRELRAGLAAHRDLKVIGVMAPLAVVSDLSWLAERRSDFWSELDRNYPGRVHLFEMLAPDGTPDGPGAYLHNKMTIADDAVVTFGSVNFSRRSHYHDSEIMVTVGGASSADGASFAAQVREARWARHLGLAPKPQPRPLDDMLAAFTLPPVGARIERWRRPWPTTSGLERDLARDAYDVLLDPMP